MDMPSAVGFDCSVIISQIRRLWMSGRQTFHNRAPSSRSGLDADTIING